jgi:hypothetical protein
MAKLLQQKTARRVADGTGRKKLNGAARPAKTLAPKTRSRKRPTLRDLNRLLASEHDELLRRARANCLRLTGRETL